MIRNMLRFGLTLFTVAAVAAGLLGWVYGMTSPIIEANSRAVENATRRVVLPEAGEFEDCEQGEFDFCDYFEKHRSDFPALDSVARGVGGGGVVVGFVVRTAPRGYGGLIVMLVGVDLDGRAVKVEVISATGETPGLGDRITNPEEGFLERFTNKTADAAAVDALSGATVSSMAVSVGVTQALEFMNRMLGDGVQ